MKLYSTSKIGLFRSSLARPLSRRPLEMKLQKDHHYTHKHEEIRRMSFRFTKRWFPLQLRTIRRRLIVGCLLMGAALLSCAFTSSPPLHAQVAHALVSPGTWAATGSLQQPRSGYT